jgi:L-alanine-DL-glutamate epimerase-like enolase superfamily enzyme
MGRDVSSAYRITPERSIKECGYAPKEYRIDCLNGAVQDALWDISGQDTAITFCKLLTDKTEKDSCYNTIIPRMREVAHNDAEKQIFCGKVETSYRSICF